MRVAPALAGGVAPGPRAEAPRGRAGDGRPGRGRVMWPLTVPPPTPLLLLLLCPGLAGQVGPGGQVRARGVLEGKGAAGWEGCSEASRGKRDLGLHEPPASPPELQGGWGRGAGVAAGGRSWDIILIGGASGVA